MCKSNNNQKTVGFFKDQVYKTDMETDASKSN